MAERGLFDLSGRVALVTGGGHGLGREFCYALAEFGADVACDDINIELARETVELIKGFGHRAIAIEADISQPDQVERMVNQTVAEMGTIDVLFAHAGGGSPRAKIHEQSIEDFDKTVALNLRGTFLCMKAVLPVMLEQKRGSIITTASVAGIRAAVVVPDSAPYGAAKAGVVGLTKHAAVQYAKDGIRVNAIAPGATPTWPRTDISDDFQKLNDTLAGVTPMGRNGIPSEFRGLAVFLASDASSYATGQVFANDGGRTA